MSDLKTELAKLENLKRRRDKELQANGKTQKYHDLHAQYLQCLSDVGKATEK